MDNLFSNLLTWSGLLLTVLASSLLLVKALPAAAGMLFGFILIGMGGLTYKSRHRNAGVNRGTK